MASGKTTVHQNDVLDHFVGGTVKGTTTGYLALFSVAPTEGSGGTELTVANGYAREDALLQAAAAGVATNGTTAVTFSATGTWSAIVGHAIMNASTAGAMLYYQDTVSGPTLENGDSYEFAISAITVNET